MVFFYFLTQVYKKLDGDIKIHLSSNIVNEHTSNVSIEQMLSSKSSKTGSYTMIMIIAITPKSVEPGAATLQSVC